MRDPHSPAAISKELSPNDIGETGAHQAGMHIPKDNGILGFFPQLDANTKNPRAVLVAYDEDGRRWDFMFIYYNNIFFGGTRNEYRLTCMTPFFRQHGLAAGDTITMQRSGGTARITISYKRRRPCADKHQARLKLGSRWKEIAI